jgi:hypothetical protein
VVFAGAMLFPLLMIGTWFLNENIYYTAFCIPAIMFIGGLMTYSVRNKKGNILGFKTGTSERNMETWQYANSYCGMKMIKWSVPVLLVSEVVMFIVQPDGFTAELMVFLQIIPYFVITFSTEQTLNKRFDYYGNRREE